MTLPECDGVLVFVYGTLRRGQRNHHLLRRATFLGEARTRPIYRLVDLGPYPGLCDWPENGFAVQGEVWQVDPATLALLDALEEVPTLYRRQSIELQDDFGEVQAYFYNAPFPPGLPTSDRWPMPQSASDER